MRIPQIEIFAAPRTPEMFDSIRDGIERGINEQSRQPTSLSGIILAAGQDGFDRAIKRDGVNVAPLCRRIPTGGVMA